MRLSFEEVKSITFGFVHSFEDANGMHFAKCTDKQVAAFGSFWEGLGNNAKATTGIRLDFHTSSKRFAFGAASGRRFELYINGTFREIYKAQDGEGAELSYDINEAGEENRVTLYFPAHDTPGVLSYVELDDGATVVPHKFDCKIFFIGDSITQGWNSTYDSLSYANRVSDFFNADSVIQGVGGAFFHPSIFDEAIDYDPDFVIFAFGTNDWGIQKSHDELRANAAAFIEAITKKFAGKKIFGLSPIWRGNSGELKPAGYFVDVCKTVKEEIVKHGVTLIDGETLTPHMTDFFADLYLHPNGLGFGVYAENLCKQLKEYIW